MYNDYVCVRARLVCEHFGVHVGVVQTPGVGIVEAGTATACTGTFNKLNLRCQKNAVLVGKCPWHAKNDAVYPHWRSLPPPASTYSKWQTTAAPVL